MASFHCLKPSRLLIKVRIKIKPLTTYIRTFKLESDHLHPSQTHPLLILKTHCTPRPHQGIYSSPKWAVLCQLQPGFPRALAPVEIPSSVWKSSLPPSPLPQITPLMLLQDQASPWGSSSLVLLRGAIKPCVVIFSCIAGTVFRSVCIKCLPHSLVHSMCSVNFHSFKS